MSEVDGERKNERETDECERESTTTEARREFNIVGMNTHTHTYSA